MRLIVGDGLRLMAVGVALGSAGLLAISRLLANQLYGVTAYDPATFLIVTGVLAVVALLAACIPALKALHVDPVTALRWE
jgi:ABC-type antimicrobial peptide transport system permease subunit